MNAHCEPVIGTIRRELLDHIPIMDEGHVLQVLKTYEEHYNGHRPHQARDQQPPAGQQHPAAVHDPDPSRVLRTRILSGLINEYRHAALPAATTFRAAQDVLSIEGGQAETPERRANDGEAGVPRDYHGVSALPGRCCQPSRFEAEGAMETWADARWQVAGSTAVGWWCTGNRAVLGPGTSDSVGARSTRRTSRWAHTIPLLPCT
ncbi:MAG TPA: integrase core domain-containing protein [Umezawaea sp.]|nr:integrase core domain-containing protein [Umezawaea sp.]